jgi:transcription elongation GreA/GreB family factor
MNLLKQELLDVCISIQQQKVDKLSAMVDTLNDSAVNSDKCVVGDKHHTFRAQTQNEQELYAKQLNLAINELNTLKLVSQEKKFERATLGALLTTTNGIYFLTTSLGMVKLREKQIMVLSPISPIGSSFLNKIVGEKIIFRDKEIEILSID